MPDHEMSNMPAGTGQKPVVSLLMTTWNCREALKKTLKSVLTQDYPAIEIVIKDGASSDGTVDVIREFGENLKRDKEHDGWTLVWETGEDSGLYDGMIQQTQR